MKVMMRKESMKKITIGIRAPKTNVQLENLEDHSAEKPTSICKMSTTCTARHNTHHCLATFA